MKDGCKDGTEFWPLQIVLDINYSAKWSRFLKKPISNEFDLIYLVDASGSMSSF